MPQSLSNILIHLIFSTKERYPYITPAMEVELYSYISGIGRELQCPIIKINGTPEHLHILFKFPRTETVAHIVEIMKKRSSKWIKTKGDEFRTFQWQAGYGAFSIGYSNVIPLTKYIENQKEHHKKVTFQVEYRKFLKAYRIEYDERYVWD